MNHRIMNHISIVNGIYPFWNNLLRDLSITIIETFTKRLCLGRTVHSSSCLIPEVCSVYAKEHGNCCDSSLWSAFISYLININIFSTIFLLPTHYYIYRSASQNYTVFYCAIKAFHSTLFKRNILHVTGRPQGYHSYILGCFWNPCFTLYF